MSATPIGRADPYQTLCDRHPDLSERCPPLLQYAAALVGRNAGPSRALPSTAEERNALSKALSNCVKNIEALRGALGDGGKNAPPRFVRNRLRTIAGSALPFNGDAEAVAVQRLSAHPDDGRVDALLRVLADIQQAMQGQASVMKSPRGNPPNLARLGLVARLALEWQRLLKENPEPKDEFFALCCSVASLCGFEVTKPQVKGVIARLPEIGPRKVLLSKQKRK